MPSVKLTEGDLAVMMCKLSKIESNQDFIKNKVHELSMGGRPGPPTSAPFFRQSSISAATSHQGLGQQTSDASRFLPSTSAASDADDTSDNEGFEAQRRKKRKNQTVSLTYAS